MEVRHELVAMLRVTRRVLAITPNRVLQKHGAAVRRDPEVVANESRQSAAIAANAERVGIAELDERSGFAIGTEIIQLRPGHSRVTR
jgi:hypothetical protein